MNSKTENLFTPVPTPVILAGLFLFALAIRALPAYRAFGTAFLGAHQDSRPERVYFFGADAWYHMRRIVYANANGLALPVPDPYLNYPEGGVSHWGPWFDQGAALASQMMGAAALSRHSLEVFCAWIPAVLGALCALPGFWIARQLFGLKTGIATGLLVAFLPAHVEYSMLGHLDHHVAESLLLALLSALILFIRRGGNAATAGCVAGGLALWTFFMIVPAVAAMAAGLLWIILLAEVLGGKTASPLSALFFAIPAALLIPEALPSLRGGGDSVQKLSNLPSWLMFESFSFFHVTALSFFAASLYAFTGFWKQPRGSREYGLAVLFSASMSVMLGALLLWPVLSGIQNVLLKSSPWIKYIAEYRPLLMPYPDPAIKPAFAFQTCTYLLPLVPFAWFALGRKFRDPFIWTWPALLFALAMLQLRYIYFFSYALALLMAACGAWWLESSLKISRLKKRLLLAAVCVAAFWPSFRWLTTLAMGSRYRYLTISDQGYDMLAALRTHSAKTAGFNPVGEKPEYGVMAPWSLGHALIYLAERPAVADPFGHGIDKSARYYTAESAAQALDVLKESKAGYVVGQDMSDATTARIYGDYLHLPPEHALMKGEWTRLFHMRVLTELPASAGDKAAEGGQGHRLVYRSEDGSESLYKILLAGAGPRQETASKSPSSPDLPDASPALPSPFAAQAGTESLSGGIVARVGAHGVVSEQDLKDFTDSNACRGEDALISRKAGFMQMLEAALQEEILWRDGKIKISREEYEIERLRIDSGTRAPEVLLCMKEKFSFQKGENRFASPERYNQYLRVFIRPILAGQKGHRYFGFDANLQKAAYAARDKAQALLQKTTSFEKTGDMLGLIYSSAAYASEGAHKSGWSPFQKLFIDEHLKKLSPGESLADPIESDQEIKFVKLLSAEGGAYLFETLIIRKLALPDIARGAKKIPVEISDGELKDWVSSIHGNPLLWSIELK